MRDGYTPDDPWFQAWLAGDQEEFERRLTRPWLDLIREVTGRGVQIMRGWANYFRHAVCKHTLNALENFAWHRVMAWRMKLHRWRWKDVRRRHTGPNGRWLRPHADGIERKELFL
jgi:hypothetical protein